MAASWLSTLPAAAQQLAPANLPDEYTVKAVFLYSFGRHVQWPATAFSGASEPFVIAIAGEDSFAGALDEIAAKKTVQGRQIVIRRLAPQEAYRDPCQILFVSRSLLPDEQAGLINTTQGKPVLVVGETPGFAGKGGIVNFFTDGDRIRFEINVDTARRAQLRMDAQLLSLGKPVSTQRAAN